MTENEAIKIIGEVPVSLHYEGSLGKIKKAYDVVRKAVEKVQAFEAIGTIDEFKALKEKSVAKKPIKVDSGVYDYECDYECPKCKNNVNEVEHCSYCDCGQKLDWSE